MLAGEYGAEAVVSREPYLFEVLVQDSTQISISDTVQIRKVRSAFPPDSMQPTFIMTIRSVSHSQSVSPAFVDFSN